MFKKFFKQFKYGKKGFTLIELLVVVAILGVLAAVAIPNISKFISSGTVTAANTEMASVQTAEAAFMIANGNASTSTESDLQPYMDKPIKGDYTFDTAGKLTGASYSGVSFDATAAQFK
jgi:type IV pilus assembly protein PilA